MMVDANDSGPVEKSLDVTRSLVLARLSNTMNDESPESFNNIIYALLDGTFNMPKETVERIIKFPQLEAQPVNKDFACKCLVSFRSRVHKHRLIAQKAKLQAPTTVETIMEIPKEILEIEDELEVADEYGGDEDDSSNTNGNSVSNTPQCVPEQSSSIVALTSENLTAKLKDDIEVAAESDPSSIKTAEAIASNVENLKDTCATQSTCSNPLDSSKLVEYAEDDAAVPESDSAEITKDSSETSTNQLPTSNNNLAKESEAGKDNVNSQSECGADDASHVLLKDVKMEVDADAIVSTNAGTKDLPPLCKVDNHKEHFMTLPLSWDGAPEFQWKTVRNSSDRRTLVIENIIWSDVANVWLYPAIVRASEVHLTFDKQDGDAKDIAGKLELKFVDETVVSSCAINYLVHLRTSKGRRLKIFLPQTKTAVRLKPDLEQRLGRIRESNELMRQLIVKPVEEDITEDQVRNVAFKDFKVQHVEFKLDALRQRCVVVTFENASIAITAHLTHQSVRFGETHGNKGWYKVFYPYAMMRHSGADGLLTKAEYKKFIENEEKKSKLERGKSQGLPEETEAKILNTGLPETEVKSEKEENNQETSSGNPVSISEEKPLEPAKQKPQKRSFLPLDSRNVPAKKPRKGIFGVRRGPLTSDLSQRSVFPLSQNNRNRRNARRKRGKRQQRGVAQNNQVGTNGEIYRLSRWGATGDAAQPNAALQRELGQPMPLLTREDYEALQNSAFSKSHPGRTFPKKQKSKITDNLKASRSTPGYNYATSYGYRPAHSPHDPELMMEERIREQRRQLILQEELLRRRMGDDVEHIPGRPGNNGYGESTSAGYYGRPSYSYLDDGYGHGLEPVNDFPHPKHYEVANDYGRNSWNGYSCPRDGFDIHESRGMPYNGYHRSRQEDGIPFGSIWR